MINAVGIANTQDAPDSFRDCGPHEKGLLEGNTVTVILITREVTYRLYLLMARAGGIEMVAHVGQIVL